jgi:tetratricopeptide (TPR) repeat protein
MTAFSAKLTDEGYRKTEIAREFAIRLKRSAPTTSVFWLDAHSAFQCEQDFLRIGVHDPPSGADHGEGQRRPVCAEYVKQCLNSRVFGKWLLVVDNVDDEAILVDPRCPLALIPVSPLGSVIFTTRNKGTALKLVDRHGSCAKNVIEVNGLSVSEATQLLLNRTGAESKTDGAQASALVAALGCHPLAILQSAGFIAQCSMTIEEYLRIYAKSDAFKMRLLSDELGSGCSHQPNETRISSPVTYPLLKSFHKVRELNSIAGELLSLMACLALYNVPKQLLLETKRGDELTLIKAIGTLTRFCLITEGPKDNFSMHNLVHLVIRDWLRSTKSFDGWSATAFLLVARLFPTCRSGETRSLSKGEKYLPHAGTVLSEAPDPVIDDTMRADLAIRCSGYLQFQGLYSDAEEFARTAVELSTRVCGEWDPETLTKRSSLATTLRCHGQFQKSLEIDTKLLEHTETSLQRNHPVVLDCKENLSLTLSSLGRHEEAEALQRWVMERRISTIGPEHARTLACMNNLLISLDRQGKWTEAKQLGEETIGRKRAILGDEDLETLYTINNFAIVLEHIGDLDGAETRHREVLEGRKKQLSENHPLIITSVNNVAVVLHKKGAFAAAEEMYRLALAGAEKVLGTKDATTSTLLHNLSEALLEQEKLEEAGDLSHRALTNRQWLFGVDHPYTTSSRKIMAQVQAATLTKQNLGIDLSNSRTNECT